MIDQCFYQLNLPFNLNLEIPEFPGKVNHIVYDEKKVPELVNWLDALNLELEFSEVFRKLPDTKFGSAIHVDGLRFDHHAKINFVVGEDPGKMCWWDRKEGKKYSEFKTVIGTPYYMLDVEDAKLIAESDIKYPSVVNAGGIFHSVENVKKPRYCFSFRIRHKQTKKRVLWSEVYNIFQKFIRTNDSHRKLNLPINLKPPAISITDSRAVDLNIDLINSSLRDWLFNECRLKIKRFQLFYVPPQQGITTPRGIHADTNVSGACKLNWSYGAPGSVMRWFKFKDGIPRPKEIPASASKLYAGFSTNMVLPSYDDVEEIYRTEIGTPSLINVYQPHDIINYSSYGRYTYTMVLLDPETDYKTNLTWDRALQVFQKYIIDY